MPTGRLMAAVCTAEHGHQAGCPPTAGRHRLAEAQLYRNYVDHVMDNYSLQDFVPP